MRAGKFTDAELVLAKRMILAREALRKKDNKDVCQGNALSELYGDGWDYETRRNRGIHAVTRDDVIRAANAIFSRPTVRVLVRPAEK